MPDGSEFQTAGAATLKPREAKVVQTRGTDKATTGTDPSTISTGVPGIAII